jgi:hypothetical protein
MSVAPMWIVIAGAGFVALLAAFLLGRWRWLEDHPQPETEPEPALVEARHRAEDKAEGLPPEVQFFRGLADTVPNIRLAALAEQAAVANVELGGER